MGKYAVHAAAMLLFAGLSSCSYKTLTVAETDLVLTVEDKGRDYSGYRRYAITDTVADLCGVDVVDVVNGEGGQGGSPTSNLDADGCTPISHRMDDELLAAIERNMEKFGYTKATKENADVVVLAGAVISENWYYQPGYYWCDPYYYYSCWYPTGGYYYEITTGSILLNMIDVSESSEEKMSSVWFAALSGLYETSSEVTPTQRINNVVDRAFEQSSYLKVGGGK